MKSLHNTVLRGVSAGEPLPDPWGIFAREKMTFRRGTINMIAGPPGSMKTMLMLNIVRAMGPEVPTLYFSSDSDDFTVASRTLSMLTGETTDQSEIRVMAQERAAYEKLKEFNHIRWDFTSSPTVEGMIQEAEAYREIFGTYPHHTVVDIAMDVDCPGVAEQNYWTLFALLKDEARRQESCFTVLHHTSESAKGGAPPPSSAIMGKATQSQALVLTVWGDSHKGKQDIAAVKNRFGPQDKMANHFISLKVNPSIMLIEEADENEFKEVPLLFRDGPGVPRDEKINLLED